MFIAPIAYKEHLAGYRCVPQYLNNQMIVQGNGRRVSHMKWQGDIYTLLINNNIQSPENGSTNVQLLAENFDTGI